MHKLDVLLAWLEDNIDCGTDIEFAEGIDSAAMIPAVQAAVSLLQMPKAVRCDKPWSEYFRTDAATSLEMNRAEAQIWNEAQNFVRKTLTTE